MRRLIRWLVWLTLPLCALALSEPLLRLADPVGLQYFRRSKLIHAYHPVYTIALRPSSREYLKHFSGLWEGWFTINSLGMRDTEEPKKGIAKMICLGDSLSMGFGVGDNDAMCHLLKSPASKNGIQVLNASVDGFGTLAYKVRSEELVEQLDDVKTILLFPTPTDWWIPERFRERGILPDDEKDARRTDDPLYRNLFRIQFEATGMFYTLQAAKLAQEQLQLQAAMLDQDIVAWKNGVACRSIAENLEVAEDGFLAAFTPTRRSGGDRNPGSVDLSTIAAWDPESGTCTRVRRYPDQRQEKATGFTCPEPVPPSIACVDKEPDPGPMPEFTRKNLEALIALSREHGIRLVVVRLPMQEEEVRCNAIGKHHPFEAYAVQARRFFVERGVDVIDLMPFTKSMCVPPGPEDPSGRRISSYYLPGDGHLTVTGNRWAAGSLTEELRRIGVLKPEK